MKPWLLIGGGLAVHVLLGAGALALFAGSNENGCPCGVHGPMASRRVIDAVLDAFDARGYPREEARAAVAHESGWHPCALNCAGGRPVAGGLIQMIDGTLRSLGFSGGPAAFASLSGEVQLPLVLRFIARLPRWQVPGDAMLALAAPAFVGADDDAVVYAVGSAAWRANPTLRESPDGPITAGSIRREIV